MSFFKKLKNSKHFSVLAKKKESISTLVEDLNHRHLIVYHIDSETEGNFSLTVKNDDNGDLILLKVCDHYNLHDYKEYFGLKYTLVDNNGDHEIFWLDPFKLIGKQLKDTNNVLTFRVKHFPGKPHLIQSEYVRYLLFLQIRNYLLKGDLQLALTEETRLAAYAIQAAIGDYDDIENKTNYLADIKFLSHKPKSEEMIMEFHKDLKGKTPGEMEMEFLEKASQFDTYGAELIVVKTSKGVPINFGVSHNGIITYLHGTPANTAKIDMFPWSQIGKISYESRTLRVHFHTPDQDNSEIIKKQVMVFKCNNNRICKQLWKFILDQKSFFNFKRGIDVPKMKSSDRIFTFKSKFRYSGRCESELIAAEHETSLVSISSNGGKSNCSTLKSNGVSNGSSNGTLIKSALSFKRRTFLSPQRSTFIRVKQTEKKDSNNNSIETFKCNENSSQNTIKINETTSIKSCDMTTNTDLNMSSTQQNVNPEIDLINQLQNLPTAQATSTPTLNVKKNDLGSRKSSTATLIINNNIESNESIKESNDLSKRPVFTLQNHEEDSDEDKFFEPNLNDQTSNDQNESISRTNSRQNRLKNISCTICTIVIVLFIFFLFLFLIQHWKCKLINETNNDNDANNIIKVNMNSCGYQKTLSRLNDNFNLFTQELINLFWPNASVSNDRWIPWPIRSNSNDPNEANYDPLFFWFFRQYEEN